jgi:uncharacterized DUF497 family protein
VTTFGNFEWDDAKAAANLAKHGVGFIEAALALENDANEVSFEDPAHPERVISLVVSQFTRVLTVVTTERGERTRIISARKATAREARAYRGE